MCSQCRHPAQWMQPPHTLPLLVSTSRDCETPTWMNITLGGRAELAVPQLAGRGERARFRRTRSCTDGLCRAGSCTALSKGQRSAARVDGRGRRLSASRSGWVERWTVSVDRWYLEKVSTLDHEVFDDAVEHCVLIPHRNALLPVLPRAELPAVSPPRPHLRQNEPWRGSSTHTPIPEPPIAVSQHGLRMLFAVSSCP